MKKSIIIAAILSVIGLAAQAGFEQYTQKNYTTCLNPTALADSSVVVSKSATTGVDIMGLPGNGSLVLAYQCNNAAGAILSFQVGTCATTNGTYTIWTNAAGVSAWAYTNTVGFSKILFKPNSVSRYLRVYATPTLVTNGVAGAILVTE